MEIVNNDFRSDLFANVYHFSIGIGGLTYIGVGFGFVVATVFGAKLSDKIYIYVCLPCTLNVSAQSLISIFSLLQKMEGGVNQRCASLL
jgi:predicted MFS family arabinose efflux permease